MLPPDPGGPRTGPVTHLGDDDLALLALGEGVEGAPEHLAGCAACREELAALSLVVSTARSTAPPPAVPVPAGTWEAVAREVGIDAAPPTGPATAPASPPAVPVAVPVDVPSRRSGHRARLALAAAFLVGAAVGVGGAQLAGGGDAPTALPTAGPTASPPGEGAGTVVASAPLAPLGDAAAQAAGTATVARVDGHRRLDVDVREVAPAGGGVLEVWLLDPAGGLLSLGTLTGDHLAVVLPEAVDLSRFTVVDVSREPLDGDPGHSADSVLRGELSLPA
ncbi:anti-sigma factor [Kineococcus sp. SYSU DK024]|uniref:anti-sigma factor n=1 Tax=Kineococcus sp. SYSU DK024 TaxID=3383145 RepID=UPI003D7D6402